MTLILPSLSIISESLRSAFTDSGIFCRFGAVWTFTSYLYCSSPSVGAGGEPGALGAARVSWSTMSMPAGCIDAAAAATAAAAASADAATGRASAPLPAASPYAASATAAAVAALSASRPPAPRGAPAPPSSAAAPAPAGPVPPPPSTPRRAPRPI